MRYILIVIISIIILISGMVSGLITGSVDITIQDALNALFNFDASDTTHIIIHEVRTPRVLAVAAAGAAFAVSGAVMQAVTRNPLAEPGILGLNAGALFFLTIAIIAFPELPFTYMILLSFAGALFSALMVISAALFGKDGMTPLKVVLAGVAVTLFFSALSSAFQLYFNAGQDVAFWFQGAIQSVGWGHILAMLPWFLAAIIITIILSPVLTVISFNEETAVSLGVSVNKTRMLALVSVVMLAGLAVSVTGAVAFIGLIVPHIARYLSGADYRRLLPLSMVLGAALTVYADLAARTIIAPAELPLASLIALIGVPFFLYLARQVVHHEL